MSPGRQRYMAEQRAKKRLTLAHLLDRPCSYCGAKPGEFCMTESGFAVLTIGQMHEARLVPNNTPRKWTRLVRL
jgi:hypothetical protein